MEQAVERSTMPGALDGVMVIPEQALGDLGAEVIKVEQPGFGYDTRQWGPPFVPAGAGRDSAYFMAIW